MQRNGNKGDCVCSFVTSCIQNSPSSLCVRRHHSFKTWQRLAPLIRNLDLTLTVNGGTSVRRSYWDFLDNHSSDQLQSPQMHCWGPKEVQHRQWSVFEGVVVEKKKKKICQTDSTFYSKPTFSELRQKPSTISLMTSPKVTPQFALHFAVVFKRTKLQVGKERK